MELAFIWFISVVALGEEIKANDAEILQLQTDITALELQVDENETILLNLVGDHSAFVAEQKIINEEHRHELPDHTHWLKEETNVDTSTN